MVEGKGGARSLCNGSKGRLGLEEGIVVEREQDPRP